MFHVSFHEQKTEDETAHHAIQDTGNNHERYNHTLLGHRYQAKHDVVLHFIYVFPYKPGEVTGPMSVTIICPLITVNFL